MLCNANGTPLRFLLSDGQASDISYAQPLLDEVSIPWSQHGRPRKRCKWLLADKGYDKALPACLASRWIDWPAIDPKRTVSRPRMRQSIRHRARGN